MGLPCAHIIKERLWEGTSLTVDDFNAHRNIRRGDLTPVDYRLLIQDPEQVKALGAGRRMLLPIVPQGDFLPTLVIDDDI